MHFIYSFFCAVLLTVTIAHADNTPIPPENTRGSLPYKSYNFCLYHGWEIKEVQMSRNNNFITVLCILPNKQAISTTDLYINRNSRYRSLIEKYTTIDISRKAQEFIDDLIAQKQLSNNVPPQHMSGNFNVPNSDKKPKNPVIPDPKLNNDDNVLNLTDTEPSYVRIEDDTSPEAIRDILMSLGVYNNSTDKNATTETNGKLAEQQNKSRSQRDNQKPKSNEKMNDDAPILDLEPYIESIEIN